MTAPTPATTSCAAAGAGVIVIGDALLDVEVQPSMTVRRGRDVPAAIRIGPGGQGANLAIRLARQGVDVELVCPLADDPASAVLRDALATARVRLHAVPTDATGTVVILLDPAGERSMLSHRVPFATQAAAMLPATAARWLIVSGYLLLEAGAERFAAELATHPARPERCVLVGCTVPEPALAAWGLATRALRPDMVILNRDELAAIGAAAGPNVVVSDPDGATASIAGVTATFRSAGSPPPVDTTGAGDAFAARLVASLLAAAWPPDQSALKSALADACRLGGQVARVPGAQGPVRGERPAAPTR